MKAYILTALLFIMATPAQAQVTGCTDPLSSNYNPQATINDGSCSYVQASVSPEMSVNLPAALQETSGLILWNNRLISHNDSADTNLYAIDTGTGAVSQTFPLSNLTNQDWEEISQDEDYIYIGDFGNNSHGNRTNLRIIKVTKASLEAGVPETASVYFTYSDQNNFATASSNTTDFDCEAFIVAQDSIYLFTKQWTGKKTSVYALPKSPGTHIAQMKTTYDVNGLITGATYDEDKRVVVLTGYSPLLQPFFYILYNFTGHDFFTGNKRKLSISLSFHQTEGVASSNGLDYFVTNEKFTKAPFINVSQKLHRFNLSPYLQSYYSSMPSLGSSLSTAVGTIRIFPNPAGDVLYIEGDPSIAGLEYYFTDMTGKQVLTGILNTDVNEIDISAIADGLYYVRLQDYFNYSFRLVKKK